MKAGSDTRSSSRCLWVGRSPLPLSRSEPGCTRSDLGDRWWRVTSATASSVRPLGTEGYGNDADRVEFRFRDASNRIDLKCGRTSVPGTWLSVSHISGPAFINAIQACRQQRARVEGPDHVQQFAQLSAVIAAWYHSARAEYPEDVGTYTDEFPLSDDDFHVRARSKLRVNQLQFVRQEALAHRSHEEGQALEARGGPPALMEEAARHAVQKLGVWASSAIANVPTSAQQVYDQRVSVIGPLSEGEFASADQAEGLLPRSSRSHAGDMRFSHTKGARHAYPPARSSVGPYTMDNSTVE